MAVILTRKGFQEAIETCRFSMGSIGLKGFIDDFLRAHHPSNSDILSTLMEYVLEVYPEVENSDDWVDFHEKDYTNFSEEVSWYDQPELQYLYSYLVYLSENKLGLLDKHGRVEYAPRKIRPNLVANNDVSLKSDLSQERLKAICDALIERNLIGQMKSDDFVKIFTSTPLAEIKKYVKWQAKYSRGIDNLSLFCLLEGLTTSHIDPSYDHTYSLLKKLFTLNNTQKSLIKSYDAYKDLAPDKRKRLRTIETLLNFKFSH